MSETLQPRRPEEPETYVEDKHKAEVMAHAEVLNRDEAIAYKNAARLAVKAFLDRGGEFTAKDISESELRDTLARLQGQPKEGEKETFSEYVRKEIEINKVVNGLNEDGIDHSILGAAKNLDFMRSENIKYANKASDRAAEEYDKQQKEPQLKKVV